MKYLLIGLVVLIWGVIIYKVIRSLSVDDPPPLVTRTRQFQIEDTLSTYRLIADAYPDPFVNELIEEEEAMAEQMVSPETTMLPENLAGNVQLAPVKGIEPPPQPPLIKYNGYIYNPQTKQKTAMITINGRGMNVGVHEKIDDKTKVLKISDQKLTVSFNGSKIDYLQ